MESLDLCKLLVGAVAIVLGMPVVARAEQVMLQTLSEWTVTTLDAPETDGHRIKGTRHRAILPGPNGRPLAAIEVTGLPQDSNQAARLETFMQQAVTQAAAEFAGNHLEERCETARSIRVAEQAALRTDCTVRRGEQPVLRQAIIMFVTPASLYSISYSAGIAGYETYEPVFQQALRFAHIE